MCWPSIRRPVCLDRRSGPVLLEQAEAHGGSSWIRTIRAASAVKQMKAGGTTYLLAPSQRRAGLRLSQPAGRPVHLVDPATGKPVDVARPGAAGGPVPLMKYPTGPYGWAGICAPSWPWLPCWCCPCRPRRPLFSADESQSDRHRLLLPGLTDGYGLSANLRGLDLTATDITPSAVLHRRSAGIVHRT